MGGQIMPVTLLPALRIQKAIYISDYGLVDTKISASDKDLPVVKTRGQTKVWTTSLTKLTFQIRNIDFALNRHDPDLCLFLSPQKSWMAANWQIAPSFTVFGLYYCTRTFFKKSFTPLIFTVKLIDKDHDFMSRHPSSHLLLIDFFLYFVLLSKVIICKYRTRATINHSWFETSLEY